MKLVTSLALLAAAVVFPGAASAVTINFDVDGQGNPIPANTPITNQYANLGVTFLGLEDGREVNINAAPDPDGVAVPSAPNALTNCDDASPFCPGNRADVVQILFATGASGISLQLDSLGGASVTFNLYDALDNLLETQTVTSGGSSYVPVIFTSSDVFRIDGLQPEDSWAWAMDDLTFNADGVVPEPTTWALMIGGFGAVGGSLRRRQRTTVRFA